MVTSFPYCGRDKADGTEYISFVFLIRVSPLLCLNSTFLGSNYPLSFYFQEGGNLFLVFVKTLGRGYGHDKLESIVIPSQYFKRGCFLVGVYKPLRTNGVSSPPLYFFFGVEVPRQCVFHCFGRPPDSVRS